MSEAAGQTAGQFIIDKGYKSVLFVMGDKNSDKISIRRAIGLKSVLDSNSEKLDFLTGITCFGKGHLVVEELLKNKSYPDLLLCTNNFIALGFIQRLQSKGFSIPRDIALMTFDEYPFAPFVEPALTSIEMNMFDLGWQAAEFIIRKLDNPNATIQSFCTNPVLIERASTNGSV